MGVGRMLPSGYGNWSKPGSAHVTDQVGMLSRNEMRPVWRARAEVEAHLERTTLLTQPRSSRYY
jgi:acyl-homoserine-lactone acylase